MVRIRVVHAHVVELRNRQVHQMPPAEAAINAGPQAAIIAAKDQVGVAGINPNCMVIAVGIGGGAEAASAVRAHQQ